MNNKYNKTNKKVGGGENMDTRRPYIWIPDVDRLVRRVGVMGFVFVVVFAAAWAVMPANGAEAA